MELQVIQNKIYEIRGQKVMLDHDLADLYLVTTSNLNKAVKRNIKRFPPDFMFQLTKEEFDLLRFQNGISNRGGIRYMPHAFTEQGLAMLSGVLNSDIAIEVNISIMRVFVTIRSAILNNLAASDNIKELRNEISALKEYVEEILTDQNDLNEETRRDIDDIHIALTEMAQQTKDTQNRQRPLIGYRKH